MVNLAVPLITPWSLVDYVGSDTPEEFFESIGRLIDSVRQSANTLVPGGTTGEGHLLSIKQYRSLLEAVVRFRWDLHVRAWVLGRDEHVGTQIQIAQELWIDETMIGCGHTGDHEVRVVTAREATSPTGKIVLYNMPGWFKPLPLDFVAQCFRADNRIVGIKDSSGDADYFEELLSLKGSFPGRIISHGSEPLYGNMPADRRKLVDEVTSGTANVASQLLRQFLENPEQFRGDRTALSAVIGSYHAGFDTSTPGWAIQNYVYGLKTKSRLDGVLTGSKDFLMYGDRDKWFFPKD